VLPKYEQLLKAFRGMVHVSMPASHRNLGELTEMRKWFEERGGHVMVVPLSSRCAEDRSLFEALALAPTQMRCTARVLEDLIIDSDGVVLGCCQDFRRIETLGKAGGNSIREILEGQRRMEHARLLDEGRHQESDACKNCFTDTFGDYKKYLPDQHEMA
jgi:radical SAM protein with 4Fe4S-binding SPASM domain